MGDIKYILEDSSKVFKGKAKQKIDSKEETNRFIGYIIGCALMFLPLFLTVYIKANVISNGYKITKLVNELENLKDKESRAEAELMLIENPKSLYNIAKKMGFDYPKVEKMDISKD